MTKQMTESQVAALENRVAAVLRNGTIQQIRATLVKELRRLGVETTNDQSPIELQRLLNTEIGSASNDHS